MTPPASATFYGTVLLLTWCVWRLLQVNATYAGSYTGPMPPRGGGKWLSTGLWAPAGQPITVTISSSIAAALTGTGKLGVQIGSHSDNISGKSSWCRLPYGVLQRRWFSNAADGNSVTMASGLGGLIYIYTAWVSRPQQVDMAMACSLLAPHTQTTFSCGIRG